MLHYFTPCDRADHPWLRPLQDSADRAGIQFVVLTPQFQYKQWRNWFKLLVLHYHLQQQTDIKDSDIVFYIDAFDALVVKKPSSKLVKKMLQRCDLLYGEDAQCYPKSAKLYCRSDQAQLNGGLAVGTAGAWRKMLAGLFQDVPFKKLVKKYSIPQEQHWLLYMRHNEKDHGVKFGIDSRCKLFQNIYSSHRVHVNSKGQVVSNKYPRSRPAFLHFPGLQGYHVNNTGEYLSWLAFLNVDASQLEHLHAHVQKRQGMTLLITVVVLVLVALVINIFVLR